MIRCICLAAVCIFSGLGAAYSQSLNGTAYTLNADQLSSNNNFISQNVRVIRQNRDGLLFFGTRSGLSIYDGYKFVNFSKTGALNIGRINDVYEMADGSMLIATDNKAIFKYDKGRIHPLYTKNQHTLANFQMAPWGKLLAASREGIYEVLPGGPRAVESLLPGKRFFDLELLGNKFIAACGDNTPIIIFNSKYQVVDSLSIGTVYDMEIGNGNDIWLATPEGLKLMDKSAASKGKIILKPLPAELKAAGLDTKVITTVRTDSYQNLWIGTIYEGLYKFHDNKLAVFNKFNGFAYDRVICLYEDKEYNIWIGTDAGIFKVSNPVFDFFNRKNGLISSITCSAISLNNKTYIATNMGVSVLDERAITKFSTLTATEDCMSTDTMQGKLMFTNTNQLHLVDLSLKKEQVIYTLPDGVTFNPATRPVPGDRNKFFLTNKGILAGYGTKFSYLPAVNDDVRAMLIDKKRQLLFTADHQAGLKVYSYRDSVGKLYVKPLYKTVLPSYAQSLVLSSKGELWAGTLKNGISKFSVTGDGKLNPAGKYDYNSGLSSNIIYCMYKDSHQNIWVGTDAGVDKLCSTNKHTVIQNFYKLYNFQQEVYSIYESPDGNVWLSGFDGLVKVYHSRQLKRPGSPNVLLNMVRVSGNTDTVYNYPDSKRIKLSYTDNTLSFEYASPGFRKERSRLYSFRLLGSNDTAWSTPSLKNSVIFAQVKPGRYAFQVKAGDADGQWSVKPAVFYFIIRPPFWLTTWFFVLSAAVFFMVIYGIYRYRINQIQKVMLIRNRISRDLHDDVGATLSSIKILTEVARKKLINNQAEESVNLLEKIGHQSVEMIDQMGDIIWSVNPSNDSLDRLIERIQNQFNSLCIARGIVLSIEMRDALQVQKLRMEHRKHLYLIIKESLNNALKYAGGNAIIMRIWVEASKLSISIKDNGQGFNKNDANCGNGLRNMRDRVKLIGGVLDICSANGEGTEIKIKCPLT
ncbi:histidine kinase [Mucilaginibacter sp. UR6-1]|uniref:sensor histidine kinase n=1 Tax=Mucilaginibacter sp. UR6-1 TaxID=1435643 RepID=UPI001E2C6A5A|nr:sensor histidine kinase [Mucilaginibacter sp. UR6-1]MCC8407921.1 histidine kinase [Mucilaginibacter sp. UR6-1]